VQQDAFSAFGANVTHEPAATTESE
jgi:hypothetical protein